MIKSFYKSIKDLYNIIFYYLDYLIYVFFNINNDKSIFDLQTKKKAVLMQTPLHGNLGDQAIAYAEKEFIQANFAEYTLLEVSFSDVMKKAKNIKRILTNNDVIFIHGGGNMGDMYLPEELKRRFIISYFKDVKMISFPQTISFSHNSKGRRELGKTQKIYAKNKHLILTARESKSLKMMKEYFGDDKVIFTPDIVLTLDKRAETKREGILTCFRNDDEINISTKFKNDLLAVIQERYNKVAISDTVIKKGVNPLTRESELNILWTKMNKTEVVLTDRLHGMIFCAITCTPCIVFKNFNHKIIYSYRDWLKNLNYIQFIGMNEVKSPQDIITKIDELRAMNKSTLPFNECRNKFKPIINEIRAEIDQ